LKEREDFAADVVMELSWQNIKTDFIVADVV
jgi:hypothetical protein